MAVLRIPFAGVWREWIFWDIAASPPLGNVFLLHFSNLRGTPFSWRGGTVAGLNGQGILPSLHDAVGDNGLGALRFCSGGSSFSSVAAQPELRERELVGPLAPTSQEDHLLLQGGSSSELSCA